MVKFSMDNYFKNTLKQRISWALNKPLKIEKKESITIKQQKAEEQKKEKEWGNKMINKSDCKQWTTLLGENLVKDILILNGENPRKPETKNNFKPDWETDDYIYEVKTSSWCIDGTAGEKVLGTWIKYQDIPTLYNKPLRIICVAYQEWELTHGKTKYFGNITPKTQQILDLCKSWNIEYMKFSDLIKTNNVKEIYESVKLETEEPVKLETVENIETKEPVKLETKEPVKLETKEPVKLETVENIETKKPVKIKDKCNTCNWCHCSMSGHCMCPEACDDCVCGACGNRKYPGKNCC